MKNRVLVPVVSMFLGASLIFSCTKDKTVTSETSEVITSQEGDKYAVDTVNSKVEWKGFKVFKSENTSHFGTIKFTSGDVTVKDGLLESGKFTVDMNSLSTVDLTADTGKDKLDGHLKSADFFDVAQFGDASFEISKVTKSEVGDYNTILDGNLTIKGITKPQQFNANVSVSGDVVTIATQPTEVKREDFGVKFQSPIENGVIKNEIELQILVKANKGN